jgi:hypothetical protein
VKDAWRDHLLAVQLPGDNDPAAAADAVDLKCGRGEIDADGANLHVDAPFRWLVANDHHLAQVVPGAGVVNPVKSASSQSRMIR